MSKFVAVRSSHHPSKLVPAKAGSWNPAGIMAKVFVILIFCVGLVACGLNAADAPYPKGTQAKNKQLLNGRRVWVANCIRCHGAKGKGDVGPRLAGVVAKKYPDRKDQERFVRHGQGIMPAFGERLSDEEIENVVRYTREVL